MSELENMDIQINLKGDATDAISSAEDTLLSIEQTDAAVSILLKKLREVNELFNYEGENRLFGQDLNRQIQFTEQNIKRLRDIRLNVDRSLGEESRATETALFNQMFAYTKKRVDDLSSSMQIMHEFKNMMSASDFSDFSAVMKKAYAPMRSALEVYAKSATKALGTQTPEYIIDSFMKTPEYRSIVSGYNAPHSNSHIFNQSNMKQYLKSIAVAAIPTRINQEYVDWAGDRRSVQNVQQLLPDSFKDIQLGRVAVPTRTGSHESFSQKLSKDELSTLEKIITENQYIAREAESAGLIKRHHGTVFMNKAATRGNVNAFAGEIAHLFSLGAMGLPMYGIEDIYDVKHLNSIAAKNNKSISQARRVADMLHSQYKGWLDPAYYKTIPKLSDKAYDWYDAGKVKASGRQDRMQFLEIDPSEISTDGTIAFRDGQKRWTPVVKSAYQSYLSKQDVATKFTHNGINDNEIFVKLPNDQYAEALHGNDVDRQKAIEAEVARAIGAHIQHDGYGYTMTGLTKTHIAYTRDDIIDAITKNPEDKDFFYNGESRRKFNTYQDFAKAATYRRLMRTEGEDLSEIYGFDTNELRVLVADIKKLSGSDGQNIVNNKLFPEGFQSRSFAGKSTNSPLDFEWMKKVYGDPITGLVTLPGAGLGGVDLVFNPDDYDIIEDVENIKTNKDVWKGMSSQEAGKLRSAMYARYGVFGKTSYDAANTSSRYLSAQMANTMAFTPEAQRYFQGVYLSELAALDDVGMAIDLLFSGDDALSMDVRRDNALINSKEAQKRIEDYRDSLNRHNAEGDILLPRGVAQYGMAAGWVPDILNNILVKGGKTLTQDQAKAGLGKDVFFLLNQSESLGLGRNPATFDGNIESANKAADEYFQKLADLMGIDKNAIYVNPESTILERLQGADLDGDTIFTYAIKHSKDQRFADVMRATLVNTANRYKKILEIAQLNSEDPEQAKKAIEALTSGRIKTIEYDQDEFDADNPNDLVKLWKAQRENMVGMASADAITRNAMRMPLTKTVAAAINYASTNYNVNSTRDKKAEEYIASNEERKVLGYGAPVSYIADWVSKSTIEDPSKPNSTPVFSQEEFYKRYKDRILKTNFAAANNQDDLISTMGRFYAAQINGWDVSGGIDWDKIFDEMPTGYGDDTAAGGFIRRMNELRKQQLQGKFLVWSDETLHELGLRGMDAYNEIEAAVKADDSIQNKDAEVANRYKAIGGDVLKHIVSNGITLGTLANNSELAGDIQNLIDHIGADHVFSQSTEYDHKYSDKNYQENERKLQQALDEESKLKEEQEALRKKQDENNKRRQQLIEQRKSAEDKTEAAIIDPELEDEKLQIEKDIERNSVQMASVQTTIADAQMYQKKAYDYYAAQGEYNRVFADAARFSGELHRNQRSFNAKNDDVSYAERHYETVFHNVDAKTKALTALKETWGEQLQEPQRVAIDRIINSLPADAVKEITGSGVNYAKRMLESIKEREQKTGVQYDAEEHEINEYEDKIKEAYAEKAVFEKMLGEYGSDEELAQNIKQSIADVENYIEQTETIKHKLRGNLYERNIADDSKTISHMQRFTRSRHRRYSQSAFDRQMNANENDYEQYAQIKASLEQRLSKWQKRSNDLFESGQQDTENYKLATQEINRLSSALSECQKEMDGLTGASGRNKAVMTAIGETANRAIHQFASNVFHKAINEAQNFVVTYDDAMTEIQMVTLKTDSEIDTLGDGLIEKAVDLKAAVGDVTSAATSLYRQGLGDEVVDERLDDVIKFSTTAKVKTDDAIKLITVALNSGLVESSEDAMDVISALGDSAATEAAQITKGLQKSMSAAKEVGVTYEQLVSMLTVITSKTQLSGSVAGTTMRNVMSRLARVSPSDMIYDERGHAISGSDQARVLRSIGIDTYDSEGNFRGAYQILSDIGKVWNDLVDAQKQSVAYVLGGTEQFSNVAALMQGFSEVDENGVSWMDKYLEIAEQSDNATSEKYEHYMNSLAGAMTNVKNSWDALVNSATDSDPVIVALNVFSDSLNGITKFNQQLHGIPSTLALITAAVVGLNAVMKLNPMFRGVSLAIGAITLGGALFNHLAPESDKETISKRASEIDKTSSNKTSLINKARDINAKRNSEGELSSNDFTELKRVFIELSEFGDETFDASKNLDTLARNAKDTAKALDLMETAVEHKTQKDRTKIFQDVVSSMRSGPIQEVASSGEVDIYAPLYEDLKGTTILEGAQRYLEYQVTKQKDDLTDEDYARLMQYEDSESFEYDKESANRFMHFAHQQQFAQAPQLHDDLIGDVYFNDLAPNIGPNEFFYRNNADLMQWLFTLANNNSIMSTYQTTDSTFGSSYKDQLMEAAIANGIDKELADMVLTDKLAKIDAAYEESGYAENFDPRPYLNDLYRDEILSELQFESYAAEFTPNQYYAQKEQETVTQSPMHQVGNAAANAKLNNKIDTYGPAYAQLSSAYLGSQGTTTQQQVESFVNQIGDPENGIQNLNAVIESNDELAAVLASIVTYDEKRKKYSASENVGEAEWATLGRILAEQDARTHLDAYRGASDVASSALSTFEILKALDVDARRNQWENLSVDDATNKQLQSDLENILGEDLLYRFVNGLLDEDGMSYAQSKINAYEAESRIDPSNLQDEVLSLLKSLTGSYSEQMSQFASLQSEQTSYERALYSYDRVSTGRGTFEDYSQIGSAIGLDADVVQNMARTEEGRKQLEADLKKRIGIYSDILSQALLALLPEDAIDDLQADMDIDDILTVFKENVSEDVYAIIETVLKSIGVTYDGESFDADIDVDSGSISALQAASDYRTEYQGTHRDDEMLTYLKEAIVSNVDLESYVQQNKSNEKWDDFYGNNPMIGSAVASYSAGENVINKEQLLTLINEALYGGEKSSAFYDIGASAILGDNYEDGNLDWQSVLETYARLKDTDIGDVLIGSMEDNEEFVNIVNLLNDALKDGSINAEDAEAALKKYNDSMDSDETAKQLKYNKAMQKTVSTLDAIRSGGEDAANAYNDLFKQSQNLANANWALNQYKLGNKSDNVLSTLSSQFHIDEKDLKNASEKQAELYYATMSEAYADQSSQLETNLETNINDVLTGYMNQLPEGTDIDLGKFVVGGVVDVSGLTRAFAESDVIVSSAWSSLITALSSLGATFTVGADGNTIQVDTSSVTKKSYGGGSGGSKKSSADKLVEKLGHGQSLYEHQIKMVQYEQTKYENADELGNYGRMIEEEIKIEKAYLPVLESNIAAMKSELASVKEGTEDWYKLRDAILDAEEQYADINNTIDENEKKLEENHQAILKLHTDLEEAVVGEIELRIESEKEMLDGSVSMQGIILNAIKQRYQDEWDIIKKDIEKKKEALQQEKDLIDERLDARREAEDEAAKYEELAELKKQLSLISMDSTRTKDAAALRESIAELEKEIGWDIADKNAENEKGIIQDQIDAYDDYVTSGDEDLEELLSDANNFASEVNSVLMLSQSELFDWLKQNVKEYTESLDDAQKQMVQSWESTYKQMLGITDTYWDEVNAILSAKDTFLEYMKQSEEYIYASDDEREQLLYQWGDAYDKWRLAQKNNANYSHGDSGLGSWTGSEYTSSSSSGSGGSGGASNNYTGTPGINGNSGTQYSDTNYRMEFSTTTGAPLVSYNDNLSQMQSSAISASLAQPGKTVYIYGSDGKLLYQYKDGKLVTKEPTTSSSTGNASGGTSGSLPETGWPSYLSSTNNHGYYYKVTKDGKNIQGTLGKASTREEAQKKAAALAAQYGGKYQTKYFKHGGIADFTGPAWLDGSLSEPERILNAQQTRDFDTLVKIMDDFRNRGVSMDILRSMASWSSTVNIPFSMSHIGNAAYQGNSANIGDIFVNITEAQISDDRDIEELANIVGQKFVKEIGKQGFNVSRYNF